jgi:cytochrome c
MAATGLASLLAASASSDSGAYGSSEGARAYQKCLSCHAISPAGDDRDGPTLYQIIGRSVAAIEGFTYSPGMRSFADREPVWTRANLNRFIADPYELVPDNEMGFFGISDAAERAALIDWLESRPAIGQ